MTDQPDFRTDKSASVEGAGNAVARWYGYHEALDQDVLAEAFPGKVKRFRARFGAHPDEY